MIRIVNLLEEKNLYLEKFYKLNEAELVNLADDIHDNIENFYAAREGLLKMVSKIDDLVEEQIKINDIDIKKATGLVKKRIINAFSIKNELVNLILSQDLQIISYIEKAKSSLIQELSEVNKARNVMQAYKSNRKI